MEATEFNRLVNFFDSSMKDTFGDDIVRKEIAYNYDVMGVFSLKYEYLPLKYRIWIDGEYANFIVNISNDRGGVTSLHLIRKHDTRLSENSIRDLVVLLKEMLETEDIVFAYTEEYIKYTNVKNPNIYNARWDNSKGVVRTGTYDGFFALVCPWRKLKAEGY